MTKKKRTRTTSVSLPRSVRRLFPNVTHAVDAKQAVEVTVETQDCRGAKRLNPSECALARAARREFKDIDGAIIGMATSYIIRGQEAIRFATPESVRREIVSFDRHDDFAPGEYYLTPKSPTARLGEDHRRRTSSSNPDKVVKRKVHNSVRVRALPSGVST